MRRMAYNCPLWRSVLIRLRILRWPICWWHGKHRLRLLGGWSIEQPFTEWACLDCNVSRFAPAGVAPRSDA